MQKNINKMRIIFYTALLVILIAAVYFHNNASNIYTGMGNYYVKHNNQEKAIEYYEKSYNLGNKDAKFRTAYVNLLINSPLSIATQEKIVKFTEGEIKDSASESAKHFLYNLKREIHNKYPQNYIKHSPYSNNIIHWGKFPITYAFKNTKGVPDELIEAVNSAFDEWERASSARIRFDRVNTSNANIVITFTGKRFGKAELGKKYVIASTIPTVTQNKLDKMNMQLNVFDIDGKFFSSNQMYNTALHEIFHALGFMGHSYNNDDIMYMSQDYESAETEQKKKLSASDKITLELLYKIKPDITNAAEIEYDYIPYLIIGDNTEINNAKKTEARNYIKKAPTVPSGYIDLAQTYAEQKNYTKAIACLERALRLADNNSTRYLVYYNLGVTNYYDGNYELCHFYIGKAKDIKDNRELHLLSAEVYVKQDKIPQAISEYKYLIESAPDNIDYAINLANLYINNKKYLEARKVLKEYIKRNPSEKNNNNLSPYKMLLL